MQNNNEGTESQSGTAAPTDYRTPTPDSDSSGPSAETAPLRTGMVLAGRYEVGEQLGAGGMGTVFEAYDRLAQEIIAIKALRDDLFFSTHAKERFLGEAKISRNLSHPRIVRVYDVGVAGRCHYFTMERLRGMSLRDRIERQKADGAPFPVADVLSIAGQLIDALQYAQHLIVHRDLKPENIWLKPDGSVKLMDFGIARIFADLKDTRTRMSLGTPYYMAPEQRQSPKDVDWRTDQYALGIIIFEMLIGHVPEGAFRAPREIRREISSGVSTAIMKALAPERERRHGSWEEFGRELRHEGAARPYKRSSHAVLISLAAGAVMLAALLWWLADMPPTTVRQTEPPDQQQTPAVVTPQPTADNKTYDAVAAPHSSNTDTTKAPSRQAPPSPSAPTERSADANDSERIKIAKDVQKARLEVPVTTRPEPAPGSPESIDARLCSIRTPDSSWTGVVVPRSDPRYPLAQPDYPPSARRSGEHGKVIVDACVRVDGTVGAVRLKQSSGFRALDDAAMQVVRHEWRLQPGTIRDVATPMWAQFAVAFSLTD